MAIDLSCFDNIVGLSDSDCDCFSDNRPAGYNTSTSGKYIDEHLSLNAVGNDCAEGNRWDLLDSARSEAILAFYNDLLVNIRKNQNLKFNPYSGFIGNNSASGNITGLSTYAGIKLTQRDIKGGRLTIKTIALWSNTTGNVSVTVYSQEGDEYTSLGVYTVPTTANKIVPYTLPTPLEIDMYSHECEYKSIYIVYPVGAMQIKKNEIHCGCGGKKNKVCNPPCFGWDMHQQRRWTEFTQVSGVSGVDLADIESWSENTTLANGLRINVYYDCRILDAICAIAQDENHPMFLEIATAINWSGAFRAWQKVINSGQLNRYTALIGDECYGKRNHAQKEYLETLDGITKQLTPALLAADCYTCKENIRRVRLIK